MSKQDASRGGKEMKFPNLLWAARQKQMAQFELAGIVGISEPKLGRAKERLARGPSITSLGWCQTWPRPPPGRGV